MTSHGRGPARRRLRRDRPPRRPRRIQLAALGGRTPTQLLGKLTVWHGRHGGQITLPAWYVGEHVELSYAGVSNTLFSRGGRGGRHQLAAGVVLVGLVTRRHYAHVTAQLVASRSTAGHMGRPGFGRRQACSVRARGSFERRWRRMADRGGDRDSAGTDPTRGRSTRDCTLGRHRRLAVAAGCAVAADSRHAAPADPGRREDLPGELTFDQPLVERSAM